MPLAHLHTRSWFSFLAGGSPPEGLVARGVELGVPAMALTDRNGLYGVVRFQKACRAAGIRSIVGAEATVEGSPLVLLARSRRGYENLCRILTAAHLASRDEPSARLEDLEEHGEELWCLTGAREGRLHSLVSQGESREARGWLDRLRSIFGERLRIELTHGLRPRDGAIVERMVELGRSLSIPTVATGDVRYATRDDHRRYDLLSCIRLGCRVYENHPERPVNAEQTFKSDGAMLRLIPHPDAFERAEEVAEDCRVDLLPEQLTPPEALLPRETTASELLGELCIDGLLSRYPNGHQTKALEQLRRELGVITSLELEEYFLVVREVVSEAKRRGIRCAGRGSAANSIVAYLLGITAVDPLAHNLLFERFLHGGRKGTPDIDVDFDAERRDEVIAWMEDRFGMEQTAMTATLITYGLRSALRETAKALGWPEPVLNALAKAVPHGRARNVMEYREAIAEVVGESAMLDVLVTMVAALDDCPRHLGLHSGGMVLSREPLPRFTPIQVSANGVKEVQFDKNDVEALGLIKLDVLGLRMLATLSEAVEMVERAEGRPCDIDDLPLDDERVYRLIRSGRTIGLFQIESQGQMHLLAQHQPRTFNDLISEIALFRPGPLQGGMVHPFVRRRRGLEPTVYEHPSLEPILKDTYGVILFQEQILEVAHHFAGMSMVEADDFRSLMSKYRDRTEMEGMRSKFVAGAMRQGVAEETANSVFDKVANFVGYGFCRSHAAAFAKTVYQSAWMKCHHPAAFMAAVMQHRPGMYNMTTLEEEARRFGAETLLPDINISGTRYDLEWTERGKLAIRKPLTTVTGMSTDVAKAIVNERMTGGPFTSVEDLYRRLPLERDLLDWLARSGALDAIAGSTRRALWEIGLCANRIGSSGIPPVATLLDLPTFDEKDIPYLQELTPTERISWDYLAQGSARRHPITLIRRQLTDLEIRTIETCYRFAPAPYRRGTPRPRLPVVVTSGIVILRQMPPTAKGTMFITLEDETGFIQCVVKPEVRERLGWMLTQPALIVRGELHREGEWRGLLVADAWTLHGVLGGYEGYASAYGGTDHRSDTTEEIDGGIRTDYNVTAPAPPPATKRREPGYRRGRVAGYFDYLARTVERGAEEGRWFRGYR